MNNSTTCARQNRANARIAAPDALSFLSHLSFPKKKKKKKRNNVMAD